MNKRIEWVDICKFLAISLMIAGHIGVPKMLDVIIHAFHMPVFFILAGLVYDESKNMLFGEYIKKRAKQLLTPYFVYGAISYIWYVIFSKFSHSEYYGIAVFLKEMFFMDAANPAFAGVGIVQWFFTAMLFCSIFSWIMLRISLILKWPLAFKTGCIILLLIVSTVLKYLHVPNILGMVSGIIGSAFYILGNILRGCVSRLESVSILEIFFWGVVFILTLIFNGSTNLRIPKVNRIILFYLGGVAGSFLLFWISNLIYKFLNRSKMYTFIIVLGQNTAIILAVNRILQIFIIEPVINYILQVAKLPFIASVNKIIIMLIELLLLFPVIKFITTYLPFTMGKRNKKIEYISGKNNLDV